MTVAPPVPEGVGLTGNETTDHVGLQRTLALVPYGSLMCAAGAGLAADMGNIMNPSQWMGAGRKRCCRPSGTPNQGTDRVPHKHWPCGPGQPAAVPRRTGIGDLRFVCRAPVTNGDER